MFGAVKLIKHANIDLHKYSGYGIRFDRKGFFSIGDEVGKNVIIFGVDLSSSLHLNNKKKDILVLDEGHTKGLEHTLAAKQLYSMTFTKENSKFCLSLHYDGANSYLFVNGTEIIKFKAKDSEIAAYSLCLGNISNDFFVDDMKKTIAVVDILDIHKCLMKKNGII